VNSHNIKVSAKRTKELSAAFLNHLSLTVGRVLDNSTPLEQYRALSYVVRDQIMGHWIETVQSYRQRDVRVVAYLSAEYLLGPHLLNDLECLGCTSPVAEALQGLGISLTDLAAQEPEPGLGNGGLGRLAACFMDSLSTLNVPAIGYGLRYEFGIFRQEIQDGWQIEKSDKWLQYGNPWEIPISDASFEVKFGGHTETWRDETDGLHWRWVPSQIVKGIPYDTPIPGYRTSTVNRLRLWRAEAIESFDLAAFNSGDYMGAVQEKMRSETISKILYPSDEKESGKVLRLEQQYFFTSCSLQDMIRLHLLQHKTLDEFHRKWSIQLNDTHPSIGIAELMRLLMDEHGFEWQPAWDITRSTFGYTNHTLLPEALERWSLPLFQALLPRHLEIIFEINRRFLDDMRLKYPGDDARMRRMSLIDEDGERSVRMAHLAVVGSKAVNGVAELHTQLLQSETLHDFYEAFPRRFSNKTNGVTPRRWLMLSNPALAALINEAIGTAWHTDLYHLRDLERYTDDAGFLERWRQAQEASKASLAEYIDKTMGICIDPRSMFDVQVKRIHEYKRQHLNALHVLGLYCQLKNGALRDLQPRTFLFGGKAAPSYAMAKLMIKLVCSVADLVNSDSEVRDTLKVVFLPNYNVSLGQRIYPAADLSEQISTAGKEASGTGCMKMQMNGALTIGTLDGANIEIRQEVGEENFFLFGLTSQEIDQTRHEGYRPSDYYERDPLLREIIDGLTDGRFSQGDRDLFLPLAQNLMNLDPYMLMADFGSYRKAQFEASSAYGDATRWSRMSLLNSARSGKFSSDRTIREYCEQIWDVPVVPSRILKPKKSRKKPGGLK
jgi:starch phosphorylase